MSGNYLVVVYDRSDMAAVRGFEAEVLTPEDAVLEWADQLQEEQRS